MFQSSKDREAIINLLQSVSEGKFEEFLDCLKCVPHMDVSNERGWTALMFAARSGNSDMIRELLRRGCNALKTNSNGQTALDIAEFWLRKEIVSQLSTVSSKSAIPGGRPNYFSACPLDRAAYRRTDSSWLDKALCHPKSSFVVFSDLKPLVCIDWDANATDDDDGDRYKLARLSYDKASKLDIDWGKSIFLGVETAETANVDSSDVDSGWFTVETKSNVSEINELLPHLVVLPFPFGLRRLVRSEFAIVSQARSLLAWHDRNQFCPTCGRASVSADGGYKRKCTDVDCRSNRGVHNTCYPRTDPSIIVAVSSAGDGKLLLAQNSSRHYKGVWSVLAGFIEPGENIEEACRREVFEETKIQLGPVKYHSSQPWPMPNSLMIGCHAKALNNLIDFDKAELSSARWFSGSEIQQMFANQHPDGYILPPPQTIAHQLILHWHTSICKQDLPNA